MTTTRARWHLTLGVLGLVGVGLLLPGPGSILTDLSDPRPSVLLGGVVMALVAVLTWALTAWAAVVVAVSVLVRFPTAAGRPAAMLLHRIAPRAIRQLIGLALGTAISVSVAAPSYAADSGDRQISTSAAVDADLPVMPLDLDWAPRPGPTSGLPTAAGSESAGADSAAVDPDSEKVAADSDGSDPAIASPVSSSAPGRSTPAAVTVRPGDCLWSLAAAHLPAEASAQQIDAAWHGWYRINRAVIGADPNLLIPGQVLAVPPPGGQAAATSSPGGAL